MSRVWWYIAKNASETDLFWIADQVGQEEEIIDEYGPLPESPWPSTEGEGFELNFPSGYAQFSGAGTSDEVAALLPQLASTLYIGFAKRMRLSSGNNDSQSIATINR